MERVGRYTGLIPATKLPVRKFRNPGLSTSLSFDDYYMIDSVYAAATPRKCKVCGGDTVKSRFHDPSPELCWVCKRLKVSVEQEVAEDRERTYAIW